MNESRNGAGAASTLLTAPSRTKWRYVRLRHLFRSLRQRSESPCLPELTDEALARLALAWEELARRCPRVAKALDLYYFDRLELHGVAMTLGRSVETSALDLRFGRACLMRTLDSMREIAHSSS